MNTKGKKTMDVRDRALSAVPGYAEALAAEAVARGWMDRLRADRRVTPPSVDTDTALREAAYAGNESFDVVALIPVQRAATQEAQDREAAISRTQNVADNLGAEAKELLRAHADDMLDDLNDQLQDLVEEIQAAGKATPEHVELHDSIREVQHEVVRSILRSENDHHWTVGIYRDSLDVEGFWTAHRLESYREDRRDPFNQWLAEASSDAATSLADTNAVRQGEWFPARVVHSNIFGKQAHPVDKAALLTQAALDDNLWVPRAELMEQAHEAATAACVLTSQPPNFPYAAAALKRYRELTDTEGETPDAPKGRPSVLLSNEAKRKIGQRKLQEHLRS